MAFVFLIVAVALTTACHTTGGPDGTAAAPSDADETLDCRNPIRQDADLPQSYEEVHDAVGLPTATSAPSALQTSASGAGARFRLRAKTGLLVQSGAASQVAIARDWRDRAGLRWSNTGDEWIANVLDVGPCDGSGWLAYPGGFFVDEVACLPLDVHTGDRTTRIHVGVGTPCAGQEAPPEPTAH